MHELSFQPLRPYLVFLTTPQKQRVPDQRAPEFPDRSSRDCLRACGGIGGPLRFHKHDTLPLESIHTLRPHAQPRESAPDSRQTQSSTSEPNPQSSSDIASDQPRLFS